MDRMAVKRHGPIIAIVSVICVVIVGCTATTDPTASRAAELGIQPATAGIAAPPFALQSLAGDIVTLSGALGAPVIVNFWATWCGPCRVEMPSLERLQSELGSEARIMAISVGEPANVVETYASDLDLSLEVLLDPDRSTRDDYAVRVLPTTFIISASGTLVGRVQGSRAWDDPALVAWIRDLAVRPDATAH